ncbi:hypothetical protein G7Y89_g13871 [Cudoniella acicularis]|uniref:FAD/NAD(P)-binding domain-containing protein n=1 Tax=Cudoniella acicularis TaxID=354080 RepID=A0A8H4R6M9_9HELO|nr:hypothetical protein G7Y89_g13871 [Cudoniella acicularis]
MASSGSSRHHKVIIVGAGFNGIVAAKTYLQVDPSTDVLIVDGESEIGGVWSASRIYPGLMYEMPAPLLNFSDFNMCKELGIEMWGDVRGDQVNDFLVRYSQKFDIIKRCMLNTHVDSVERNGIGWKVLVRPARDEKGSLTTLTCDKLIVATGITSKPRIADYDLSKFGGFSFHPIEMGRRHKELVADSVHHVTIIGGHKSALEAVGTCAQAGKQVEWLIKEDGGGPTWLMPSKNPDGSSLAKMSTKRAMSVLSASIYNSSRWIDRFLHSGRWWLGTWIVTWFWGFMTRQVQQDKYTKSENGRRLKPTPESMFWFVPGGTITHDRDLETLRLIDEEKLVRVSRAHMVSVSGHEVKLSNSQSFNTDAIVMCTGWELSSRPIFSPTLAYDVGLPADPSVVPDVEKQHWKILDLAAEKQVLETYPILANPPSNVHIPKSALTPYRLFRFMVPIKMAARGDNTLIFLGNYANGRVQATAEINSLWGVAYLEGLLPPLTSALLRNQKAMEKDIAYIESFRNKRYLNCFPYRLSIFETPEYDDLILKDLGLRPDRKRMNIPSGWRGCFGLRAWVAEWFEGYFAEDYEGIVDEFLKSVGRIPGKPKP